MESKKSRGETSPAVKTWRRSRSLDLTAQVSSLHVHTYIHVPTVLSLSQAATVATFSPLSLSHTHFKNLEAVGDITKWIQGSSDLSQKCGSPLVAVGVCKQEATLFISVLWNRILSLYVEEGTFLDATMQGMLSLTSRMLLPPSILKKPPKAAFIRGIVTLFMRQGWIAAGEILTGWRNYGRIFIVWGLILDSFHGSKNKKDPPPPYYKVNFLPKKYM